MTWQLSFKHIVNSGGQERGKAIKDSVYVILSGGYESLDGCLCRKGGEDTAQEYFFVLFF